MLVRACYLYSWNPCCRRWIYFFYLYCCGSLGSDSDQIRPLIIVEHRLCCWDSSWVFREIYLFVPSDALQRCSGRKLARLNMIQELRLGNVPSTCLLAHLQCWVIRIRDPLLFWLRYPGRKKNPDPGSEKNIPDQIFLELSNNFLGLKY
jgi:hypothetical protein